jgi:hypothetical protein
MPILWGSASGFCLGVLALEAVQKHQHARATNGERKKEGENKKLGLIENEAQLLVECGKDRGHGLAQSIIL